VSVPSVPGFSELDSSLHRGKRENGQSCLLLSDLHEAGEDFRRKENRSRAHSRKQSALYHGPAGRGPCLRKGAIRHYRASQIFGGVVEGPIDGSSVGLPLFPAGWESISPTQIENPARLRLPPFRKKRERTGHPACGLGSEGTSDWVTYPGSVVLKPRIAFISFIPALQLNSVPSNSQR